MSSPAYAIALLRAMPKAEVRRRQLALAAHRADVMYETRTEPSRRKPTRRGAHCVRVELASAAWQLPPPLAPGEHRDAE